MGTKCINYGTAGGAFSEVDGKLPFEVGYKDDYACRIVIRQYSVNYEQSGPTAIRTRFPTANICQ